MRYQNPIITGFYPDPSICKANGKYYLVCSSFQYFPGVPLFESEDLINWKQIGHVLTRESQLPLLEAGSRGGIYAPTIRYNDGRFYMITTNVSGCGNFFVWTDDIYGEWSEPVFVDRDGIDPSLYFEDGKVYFTSNKWTFDGVIHIRQFEINGETGEKLSEDINIWDGTGGRYLEAPHMYKIGEYYYLLAAEGGTEYGHMIVCARSKSPYGPFEGSPYNPIITNRNKGDYILQGCGHGDLICDYSGNWWIVHLGFRQLDVRTPYHHLGREVCLVPVTFDEKGWFVAGDNGSTSLLVETDRIPDSVVQKKQMVYTFANTDVKNEWCFYRNPDMSNYELSEEGFILKGTKADLDEPEISPTFIGIRQKEMKAEVKVQVKLNEGEGGLTVLMDGDNHWDIALVKDDSGYKAIKRRSIGDMKYIEKEVKINSDTAWLKLKATNHEYFFSSEVDGKEYDFGTALTRYLSSEIAGGFTGVMLGLYAVDGVAEFKDFECTYMEA